MTMTMNEQERFDAVLGDLADVTSKLESIRDMVSVAETVETVETVEDLVANLDDAEQEARALASELKDLLRCARKIKAAACG